MPLKRYIYYCLTIIFLSGVLMSCRSREAGNHVCYKNQCVSVELAYTEQSRERGLQNRHHLPADHGMLFVFEQSGDYAFWMKDTLIPLDMIWLDSSRRVVHIAADVPPCRQDPCPSYNSDKPAMYVLEVNAGKAAKMGLKLGRQVDFRIQ